jgi:hypothetical protein
LFNRAMANCFEALDNEVLVFHKLLITLG